MNESIQQAFGHQLRVRISGILIEADQILLVSHKSLGPAGTLWAPPGGGMHFGEDMLQCLKREFKEETHLEVTVGDFLFVNEYLEPPLHAIELFFQISSYQGTVQIGQDPEMSAESQIIKNVKFVSFEEIKNGNPMMFHSIFQKITTLEDLKKCYGYHKNINLS